MTSHILIVDPVSTNRIVLKAKLLGAFYTVDVAASVAEAMTLISRNHYGAVFIAEAVDLERATHKTPSLELLQHCKSMPNGQMTVICMQDARTNPDHTDWENRCIALGADDCLIRPVPSELLLARLRNLMRDNAKHADLPHAINGGNKVGLTVVKPIAPVAVCVIGPPEAIEVLGIKSPLSQRLSQGLGPAVSVQNQPLPSLTRIACEDDVPGVVVLNAAGANVDQAISLLPQVHSSKALRDTRVVLCIADATPDQLATAYDLGAHEAFCTTSATDSICNRIRRQLRLYAHEVVRKSRVREQLKMAITDPLTGLHNRRFAMEYLSQLMTDAQETGSSFALLALDIDHFKSINDRFGHAGGDQVLKAVSECLKSSVRADDLVARSGGEEFIIVLKNTSHDVARNAAERLRRQISTLRFDLKGSDHHLQVTLSIGLAMQNGETRLEPFLERADQALYAAKAGGRNTVALSSDAA